MAICSMFDGLVWICTLTAPAWKRIPPKMKYKEVEQGYGLAVLWFGRPFPGGKVLTCRRALPSREATASSGSCPSRKVTGERSAMLQKPEAVSDMVALDLGEVGFAQNAAD